MAPLSASGRRDLIFSSNCAGSRSVRAYSFTHAYKHTRTYPPSLSLSLFVHRVVGADNRRRPNILLSPFCLGYQYDWTNRTYTPEDRVTVPQELVNYAHDSSEVKTHTGILLSLSHTLSLTRDLTPPFSLPSQAVGRRAVRAEAGGNSEKRASPQLTI